MGLIEDSSVCSPFNNSLFVQKPVKNLFFYNIRESNSSLPLWDKLLLQVHFKWKTHHGVLFSCGWKSLLYSDSLNIYKLPFVVKLRFLLSNQPNFMLFLPLTSLFSLSILKDFEEKKKTVCSLEYTVPLMTLKRTKKTSSELTTQDNFGNSLTRKGLQFILWNDNVLKQFIWYEIDKHWKNKKVIQGQLLNEVEGGASVGLAGYVAFLPWSRWYNEDVLFGSIHFFSILKMNPLTKNIIVSGLNVVEKAKLLPKKKKKI